MPIFNIRRIGHRRIKEYLTNNVLPVNNNEARIFRMKASRYVLIDDILFKKSATGLLQRCLEMEEAQQSYKTFMKVIVEIILEA